MVKDSPWSASIRGSFQLRASGSTPRETSIMAATHDMGKHGRSRERSGGSLTSRTTQRLFAENRLVLCGPPDRAQVALTFDDGPDPNYTPRVLAILQRYAVKATFFFTGERDAAGPGLCVQA